MNGIATALKFEIRRLARKELNRELAAILRELAVQRREIARLKRSLGPRSRATSNPSSTAATPPARVPNPTVDGHRFSPKGLRSHRRRLGLTAEQFGRLLRVSAQSVYAWESGRARPRIKTLVALIDLRALGKRDVLARLPKPRK